MNWLIKMDCEPIIAKSVRLVSLTDVSKLLLALVLLVGAIKPGPFVQIRTRVQVHMQYIHIIGIYIYSV